MVFSLFSKGKKRSEELLTVSLEAAGLVFRGSGALAGVAAAQWLAKGHEIPGPQGDAILYLSQLEQDGVGPTLDDQFILEWADFYRLRQFEDHADGLALLRIPPTCTLSPELLSRGALSDHDFSIGLAWSDDRGNPINITRAGGGVWDGTEWSILPEPAWRLAEAIISFAHRGHDERRREAQELAWGRIRSLARTAGARFDGFLARTVVLSPERLDLEMRSEWVGDTQVVEVIPGLEGVPREKWLESFDRHSRVQDHYVMSTEDGGMVRIIPTPAVVKILTEVKRMPGRRVAGKRAQAFIRNPYATLGGDIATALPPEVFEKARKQAGLVLYAFSCDAVREDGGKISHIVLEFIPDADDAKSPPPQQIGDKLALKTFLDAMTRAVGDREPCFKWKDKELELDGNAPAQLSRIGLWAAENWASDKPSLTAEEVFDLSRYGDRIASIGIERPVVPPYVPVDKSGKAWMPDSLAPIVKWTPPGSVVPIEIAIGKEEYRRLEAETKKAEAANAPMVSMPEWPAPLSLENAKELLSVLAPVYAAQQDDAKTADDKIAGKPEPKPEAQPVPPKPTLILKEDYVELRAEALRVDADAPPVLPNALRDDVSLKPHQLQGVAWLQHLWTLTPDVRGCVFADDMGLGKTLQLLAFVIWQHETQSDALPTLVVAPVSLLENWANEIRKFFKPGIRVLTLYGEALKDIRMPVNALDEGLVAQGLTRFLRPDWLGDAQIVLTTYETLRDLEFSLSAVRWGTMVCDEAQRIKTPSAMVTKAAKKQNAAFRVACTGTPVENRLMDLWCLFDFVQPGLLGSPTAFGKTYSRPIEAKSDEQRAAVETLRKLIEPQVMRRMKEDVTDLPPKVMDDACSRLGISPLQSALYGRAIEEYRKKVAAAKGAGAMAVLSMLHTLRTICAHPIEAGDKQLPPLPDFSKRSPKMRWLMDALATIQAKDEKVIVFTEFREIQRALQRYIGERFGLTVTVINGDTSTQAGSDKSRQARIDAFQATPGFGVIILSTTAVGFGVNVQAANHVIHFTRPWNPAKEDQATDRAYRIGQTKRVTVYCPTVVSDSFTSFEEKLDHLLRAKRELARDMLNGADDIQTEDWRDL